MAQLMDYDFNTSLYGSDGSSVLGGSSAAQVTKADTSLLDSFLKIVGTGATAYATVAASTKAKNTTVYDPSNPTKTAAPVIATPTGPALTTQAKTLIGVGIGLVVLVFGFLAFRKR